MKIRKAWSVKKCYQGLSESGLGKARSVERFVWMVKESLVKTYGNLDSALGNIEIMVPYEIGIRDLDSVFRLTAVKFNLEELRSLIEFISGNKRKMIRFSELAKVLRECTWVTPIKIDLEKSLGFQDASTFTDTITIEKHSLRLALYKGLNEKFNDFVEAFKWTTKNSTVTYFQFTKLLNYLNIPATEIILKDFFGKISLKGHITLEKFKAIWYNTDDLCMVALCPNRVQLISKYCEKHYLQMQNKGKHLYQNILLHLDSKSQIALGLKLSKMLFPTYKMIRTLITEFSRCMLHKKDWKAIELYLNTKEKPTNLYQDFFLTSLKKTPSASGFAKFQSPTRKNRTSYSVRNLRTIAYTSDTLFITSFGN